MEDSMSITVTIYQLGMASISVTAEAGVTVGEVLEAANVSADSLSIRVGTSEASVTTTLETNSDIILSAKVKGGN